MQINIAVPNNKVFKKLYDRSNQIKDQYGVNLLVTDEPTCNSLMLNNRVDAALLSPLGYGLGVTKADYRIIPAATMISEGYTRLASIYFKQGMKTINTCGSPSPEDFMIMMGKILLAERYNLYPEMKKAAGSVSDILQQYDSALVWEQSSGNDNALDISEEWFDTFDIPMPLAFWVCRAEEQPDNIAGIIGAISSTGMEPDEEINDEPENETEYGLREGHIHWHWSDDVEVHLEQTIHLLYFHQLLPQIAGIKLFGRE